MRPDHILLPLDLSTEARRALGPVGELARQNGSKVTLLHVVLALAEVPEGARLGTPVGAPDYQHERVEAEQLLRELAETLPSEVDVSVEVTTATRVPKGIVDCAEERGADLIVMSTHGRSGVRRMVLGSVTDGVLRRAHMPVLCIPPADGE